LRDRASTCGPGRDGSIAAARSHTFSDLAEAIDDAFARWDRSHLQEFTLADGTRLCDPDPDWQIEGEIEEDYRRIRLPRLRPGELFTSVFDPGDDWAHLCTAGDRRIGPVQVLRIQPDKPLPYWGWRVIPDQYRRRWDGDDGEAPRPPDPVLADLPPLLPFWDLTAHARGHGPPAVDPGEGRRFARVFEQNDADERLDRRGEHAE
jgi:hypothetical protein